MCQYQFAEQKKKLKKRGKKSGKLNPNKEIDVHCKMVEI
jgi:hypothetical protein